MDNLSEDMSPMKYFYPIAFGIFVLFVGVFVSGIFNLYGLFPHIDKVYHFSGGFALGWFFYLYLLKGNAFISQFKQFVIIVSATCFIAVLWEYAERLSTLYSPQYLPVLAHWFRGGDLNDTLLDILAGILGSAGFWLCSRLKSQGF